MGKPHRPLIHCTISTYPMHTNSKHNTMSTTQNHKPVSMEISMEYRRENNEPL